jgi:23S rRNA (uracil1939-C5)-methyltransferase
LKDSAARGRGAPVEIETGRVAALTNEAEGVIRGGKTAFVAGALPGETVTFRRTRQRRQHDEAELVEVLEPSPDRVSVRCAHFGVCGGCALQHLAPAAQLEAKRRELAESFERIARVQPERWLEPIAGPVWHYRRRARLAAKWVPKKGRVVVGFRERLAPFVAQLERCHMLAPPAGELIEPLSQLLTQLSIRDRIPQIEVAVAENATVLVLRTLREPTPEDRARLLEFEGRHGVRFYVQTGGLDTVAPLAGEPVSLSYALPAFGLELRFEPTDFIQINAAVNRALIDRVVELMALDGQARVLDLFCGLGNFTLPLARRAGHVTGVEGEARLIDRARRNATEHGLANVAFHVADLAGEAAKSASWARESYSHVLLDPPRTGAREILPTVAQIRPRRLMYISCHPGSLARDVGTLVHEHGFELRAAGAVDMFPHTTHIESLAVLEPAGRVRGAA